MANVFIQYPLLVEVLGLNGEEFYTKQKIAFLGTAPSAVQAAVEKYLAGASNAAIVSVLSKYYGTNWKCKLWQAGKTGHSENDILDISDIIITGPKIAAKPKPTAALTTTPGVVISPVHIYPEDKVSEFKEKLSILLHETSVYKQHLYTIGRDPLAGVIRIPLYYRILSEGIVSIDIKKAYNAATTQILDLPVDTILAQNKDNIIVEAKDTFITIGELYQKFNTRHFYVISLDEFISGKEQSLIELLRSDVYQSQLLYYGFVMKYWPMFATYEVWTTFLSGGAKSISANYPDLAVGLDSLTRRYAKEQEILDYKYYLTTDEPRDFLKYVPQQAILGSHLPSGMTKIIDIAIKGATLVVEPPTTAEHTSLSAYTRLNVRNLFEEVRASDAIPFIRANLWSPEGSLILTKIKSPSPVDNDPHDVQRVYEKIKYRLQLPYFNTLLMAVAATNESGRQHEDLYLILILFENGKYHVKSAFGEEIQMDFAAMFNLMQININKVIAYINNLGRGVFDSARRLQLLDKTNSAFSGLYLSLFWKMPLTSGAFDHISELLKSDAQSGIIHAFEGVPVSPGTYNYNIIKGITDYDLKDLEQISHISNYYEYLTNAKAKQKWMSLFGMGRTITFVYRTTDVKIEVQDLREKEFPFFYKYIISLLYRFEQSMMKTVRVAPTTRAALTNIKRTNLLKILKSKDPELYIFKRFGSDVVASRLCQKNHQPLIYSPDEYELLAGTTKDKAVQYWNFTTQSPMYYVCPNTKYPYLSFITGQHPRDYCLPCCKKTSANLNEDTELLSKRDRIYNTCIKQYTYTEEDSQESSSRYIMNYGKLIDIGRIGHLPEIFDKYLLYNLVDKDILLEKSEPQEWKFHDRSYSIPELLKITRHSRVKEMAISEVKHFLSGSHITPDISAVDVLKSPTKYPQEYNRISNADLSYPLLILRESDGTMHLIEGIYRLAKSIDINNETINVRIIIQSQLEKAVLPISRTAHGGISLRKAGYFLFGVSQNNVNVYNIGAGYSISAALGITFYEYIEKIIAFLSRAGGLNYFRILYRGQLSIYFRHMGDLLEMFNKLFLEVSLTLSDIVALPSLNKFTAWNELFIELTDLCFNKKVLILDDTSIDTVGTSIKSSKITENIDLILPIRAGLAAGLSTEQDINHLIPEETTAGINEYILLLRKRKKTKSLFASNHTYYPIFIFNPSSFFKNMHIEKRIFTHQDEIVKLLRKIIIDTITTGSAGELTSDNIDLNTLRAFLTALISMPCSITRYYLNTNALCYAVEITMQQKDSKFIWPIRYSPLPADVSAAARYFGAYTRTGCMSFKLVKELFDEYNKWVIIQSEEQGRYRISSETSSYNTQWNRREVMLLPSYPFIKIERFLAFGEQAIGFISSGLYYYFRPVSMTPQANYANLIALARYKYSILAEGFMKLPARYTAYYLKYDPDDLNAALLANVATVATQTSANTLDRDIVNAFYKKYKYQLFVIEIIHHLDQERNNNMRAKLRKLIRETNFRQVGDLNSFYDTLAKNIDNTDAARIRRYIEQNLLLQFDKHKVIEQFEKDVYNFDHITLSAWKDILHDYDSLPLEGKQKTRDKLLREITKLSSVFYLATSVFTSDASVSFPNIFISCADNAAPYCTRQKLYLHADDFPILADLFTADLCHSLKREFLLSSIILGNIRDYFRFVKYPGEEIYVKWE
jgi:hypothetical protein